MLEPGIFHGVFDFENAKQTGTVAAGTRLMRYDVLDNSNKENISVLPPVSITVTEFHTLLLFKNR